jgi:hypothetical protein
VAPLTDNDVPEVEPTKIFRLLAIVALVIADTVPSAAVLPIVNRPPSKVIDVVAPSAPLLLKTTSLPVMVIGPLKVFAVFPMYVCPAPAPLKVRPDPDAPEMIPVYWRLPLAVVLLIVRVALPSATVPDQTALPVPLFSKSAPMVTAEFAKALVPLD